MSNKYDHEGRKLKPFFMHGPSLGEICFRYKLVKLSNIFYPLQKNNVEILSNQIKWLEVKVIIRVPILKPFPFSRG